MPRLEITEGLRRAESHGYRHAVLAYVGSDGFPVAVAGPFQVVGGGLRVGPLDAATLPDDGQQVCVTFSHIRPRPGVGYDQRRYVNVWGAARTHEAAAAVAVLPDRAGGWDEKETPFVEYAERHVDAGLSYLDSHGAKPRLSLGWRFFLATRLPFLTATLVPVALGGAVAAYHGAFAWGWFALALVSAVSAHLGLNIANDLADDTSGADAGNVRPTLFSGGSRVIQYGLVSRRGMVALCSGLYAVSVALGVVLAATRSWWLLPLGALAVLLSVQYTSPPLRLVHRGLGEPVVALGFGPIMAAGTYLAVTTEWSWEAVWASLPVGILIALVLYVNQVPDREPDAAVGKRTLIVRWPRARVLQVYAAAVGLAGLLLVVGAAVGLVTPWALLGLAAVPLAMRVYRGMRDHYEQPYELQAAMAWGILVHLATGLLLVGGYLVAAAGT